MPMKFKDVANYYLGVKIKSTLGIGRLRQITDAGSMVIRQKDGDYPLLTNDKPLLYPLSAMTSEHKREAQRITDKFRKRISPEFMPDISELINFLREEHYDCDNLIKSGEAIDVTTLEVNPYKQ